MNDRYLCSGGGPQPQIVQFLAGAPAPQFKEILPRFSTLDYAKNILIHKFPQNFVATLPKVGY
jgi:hypothetical protein